MPQAILLAERAVGVSSDETVLVEFRAGVRTFTDGKEALRHALGKI
jgi:hypothetical protein